MICFRLSLSNQSRVDSSVDRGSSLNEPKIRATLARCYWVTSRPAAPHRKGHRNLVVAPTHNTPVHEADDQKHPLNPRSSTRKP